MQPVLHTVCEPCKLIALTCGPFQPLDPPQSLPSRTTLTSCKAHLTCWCLLRLRLKAEDNPCSLWNNEASPTEYISFGCRDPYQPGTGISNNNAYLFTTLGKYNMQNSNEQSPSSPLGKLLKALTHAYWPCTCNVYMYAQNMMLFAGACLKEDDMGMSSVATVHLRLCRYGAAVAPHSCSPSVQHQNEQMAAAGEGHCQRVPAPSASLHRHCILQDRAVHAGQQHAGGMCLAVCLLCKA